MTTEIPASAYLRDVAAPVMSDAAVADLAQRLVVENGGVLSGLEVYRLRMLLAGGPAPLTDAALAGVVVSAPPAL